MIKMVDSSHVNWSDPKCCKFTLHQLGYRADKFHIQMTYGDVKPRLVSFDQNIRMSSKLACSARMTLGYCVPKQCVWTISHTTGNYVGRQQTRSYHSSGIRSDDIFQDHLSRKFDSDLIDVQFDVRKLQENRHLDNIYQA